MAQLLGGAAPAQDPAPAPSKPPSTAPEPAAPQGPTPVPEGVPKALAPDAAVAPQAASSPAVAAAPAPEPSKEDRPTVRPAVKEWDPSTWVRFSNKFPDVLQEFELDSRFERYLLQEKGQKPKSVPSTTRHIKRLLGALDIGKYDYNSPALLGAMRRHDVLGDLREQPMFDETRTWTIKCANALCHWCAWHIDLLGPAGDQRLVAEINALLTKAKNWAKLSQSEKKVRGRRRKREHADIIPEMSDYGAIISGARRAMLDLKALGKKYAGKTSISYRDQARATVVMQGLIYQVTVGGRDGEWASLTEEYARQELLTKEKSHLEMDDHKTVADLGEAVKYIPDCLKQAFRIYWGLPTFKVTTLALRPVAGDKVSFSAGLGIYSGRYLGGRPLGVNLWRKRFTKHILLAAGVTEEKLKTLETSDKHSGKTALRDYFAITFAEEAAVCANAYRQAVGDPPEWPSEEPLEDAQADDGESAAAFGGSGGEERRCGDDGAALPSPPAEDSLEEDLEKLMGDPDALAPHRPHSQHSPEEFAARSSRQGPLMRYVRPGLHPMLVPGTAAAAEPQVEAAAAEEHPPAKRHKGMAPMQGDDVDTANSCGAEQKKGEGDQPQGPCPARRPRKGRKAAFEPDQEPENTGSGRQGIKAGHNLISVEKLKLYDDYTEKDEVGGRRLKVDPIAHTYSEFVYLVMYLI